MYTMPANSIPETQLAATVPKQGGPIKIKWEEQYPVPKPAKDEVLVKVLYTGVCQSGRLTSYSCNVNVTNLDKICTQQLAQQQVPMASLSPT